MPSQRYLTLTDSSSIRMSYHLICRRTFSWGTTSRWSASSSSSFSCAWRANTLWRAGPKCHWQRPWSARWPPWNRRALPGSPRWTPTSRRSTRRRSTTSSSGTRACCGRSTGTPAAGPPRPADRRSCPSPASRSSWRPPACTTGCSSSGRARWPSGWACSAGPMRCTTRASRRCPSWSSSTRSVRWPTSAARASPRGWLRSWRSCSP
mmetsp:Transcript_68623/g.200816  ORF Transcript_68623/g.200816 Transcript_68623/m.200816 type:complete len:207 (+) Transcript_68623:2385-3005(+)